MTHLDEMALEAAARVKADLLKELGLDANSSVAHADGRKMLLWQVELEDTASIVRAYLSALPSSPVSELVEEWRKAMEGVTPGPWETTGGSVTDFGREWPGSLSMEFIPNGYDEEINVRHKADAAWMARCSPDRIDALITTISTRNADLEREVKRLRDVNQWQPIETAPKDGTEIIARRSRRFIAFSCWWQDGEWLHYDHDDGLISYRPNEWMPFPAALSTSPQGGEHE